MEAQDKPDGKEFSLVKHIDLQELLTVNSNWFGQFDVGSISNQVQITFRIEVYYRGEVFCLSLLSASIQFHEFTYT